MGSELGIRRYKRDFPPAHHMCKIESLHETTIEKYKSDVFEVGGHRWILTFYPKGNKAVNEDGYVSLNLVISGTENLHDGWEVNVSFKFFVFDQIRDKYLTIEDADGAIKRFHAMKTEWGFAKLLSLDSFKDESNGYLVDGSCIFGVEVFVLELSRKFECISMIKSPSNNVMTWKVENFSQLNEEISDSEVFTVGGAEWKLSIYPNGYGTSKGEFLSIFLEFVAAGSKKKLYAEYKLRVKSQIQNNTHTERSIEYWFPSSGVNFGIPQFISLQDLKNPANGLIINDSLIVEAEIIVMSKV